MGLSAMPIAASVHFAVSITMSKSDAEAAETAPLVDSMFIMPDIPMSAEAADTAPLVDSMFLMPDSPLPLSPDSSGASIGLILGVPICVLSVLTGGIIVAIWFARNVKMKTGSDEGSQPGQSTLHIDFVDDTIDDTTVTTYVTTLTGEQGSGISITLPTAFATDVTASLLH
jgi:hypothetical protein